MKSVFNVGDVVSIFEDPLTCERLEGRASLVALESARDGFERWRVRFLSDHTSAVRNIKVPAPDPAESPESPLAAVSLADCKAIYYVVTLGYYGKGPSIQAAAMACKKAGSPVSEGVVAYLYVGNPDDLQKVEIDGQGSISYPQSVLSVRLFGPRDSGVKLRALLLP